MSLAECQINLIDVNFHLQKSLETFDQNSADKFWSKKDKGWKVPSLMPIRVNAYKVGSEWDEYKFLVVNGEWFQVLIC